MSDESSKHAPSWLERLSHALFHEPQDQKELLEFLQVAEQKNVLDEDALEMIKGVLDVSNMQVRDIMIPRSQMVIIEREEALSDFMPRVIESGHSRFPVIGDDRDDVIGILLAKDLLTQAYEETDNHFNIHDLLRPATFIPESKRLNILLHEFRLSHNHMAIVVDEYSGVAGLVTIEDVLEEIVGDIADEHDIDDEETDIRQNSDNEYVVKALTPIESFNDYFSSQFTDAEFETIGGIVMQGFGHLPKKDETVVLNNFRFTILQADNRRIRTLLVTQLAEAEETQLQQ